MNLKTSHHRRFTITIEDLEVWAKVGVTNQERSWPQRLLISTTLQGPVPVDDDIATALDYAAVVETIHTTVAKTEFRLLETLADTLAEAIVHRHKNEPATLTIKKFVIPSCRAVMVTRQVNSEQ